MGGSLNLDLLSSPNGPSMRASQVQIELTYEQIQQKQSNVSSGQAPFWPLVSLTRVFMATNDNQPRLQTGSIQHQLCQDGPTCKCQGRLQQQEVAGLARVHLHSSDHSPQAPMHPGCLDTCTKPDLRATAAITPITFTAHQQASCPKVHTVLHKCQSTHPMPERPSLSLHQGIADSNAVPVMPMMSRRDRGAGTVMGERPAKPVMRPSCLHCWAPCRALQSPAALAAAPRSLSKQVARAAASTGSAVAPPLQHLQLHCTALTSLVMHHSGIAFPYSGYHPGNTTSCASFGSCGLHVLEQWCRTCVAAGLAHSGLACPGRCPACGW